MLKKITKVFSFILVLTLVFSCFALPTQAESHPNYVKIGGQLNGGLFYRYYNFSEVNNTVIKDVIRQCILDWNWHVNPDDNGAGIDFCFFQVSNSTGAQIVFKEVNSVSQININATTHHLNASGRDMGTLLPKTENWYSAQIVLNVISFPRDGQGNIIFEKARGIVNHEIGHALGLDENPWDQGTIMWGETSTRTASVPTAADLAGIQDIY